MGDPTPPTGEVSPPRSPGSWPEGAEGRLNRAARFVVGAFGIYIVLTSMVGIYLGLHADEGWLAILYGVLGVSMGAAGIAGVWMSGARRGALLGWFLVGLASRAILEGDLYLVFISVPIAVVLISALVYDLARKPSAARTLGAAAGGVLAILSLVVLAMVAPYLPVICSPLPTAGQSTLLISYPAITGPFDAAVLEYASVCLARQ